MKKKLVIGAFFSLVLLSSVHLYFYYPLYQVHKINKSIDVSGINLLMPIEEAIRK